MRQLALARSPAHVPMANKQIFRSTCFVLLYIYIYMYMHKCTCRRTRRKIATGTSHIVIKTRRQAWICMHKATSRDAPGNQATLPQSTMQFAATPDPATLREDVVSEVLCLPTSLTAWHYMNFKGNQGLSTEVHLKGGFDLISVRELGSECLDL